MANPSLAMISSGYKAGKLYSVLPQDGTGDFTVSRNSVATRVNENGVIEEVAANVPRLDYSDGGCPVLLCESQSTNLYLNSATLVTQTVTTTAQSYTVSFYGTGTITFSGTYSGSLVGTGTTTRVSKTFTSTVGSLISTVSGSVLNAQIEASPDKTSYIPTTSATVTRLRDVIGKTNVSSIVSGDVLSVVCDIKFTKRALHGQHVITLMSDGSNYIRLNFRNSTGGDPNAIELYFVKGGGIIGLFRQGDYSDGYYKIGFAYNISTNTAYLYVNGVEIPSPLIALSLSSIALNEIRLGSNQANTIVDGSIYSVRIYSSQLTKSELQTLTS